ncbi:hypothetical protein AVEN_9030-1 [Araneus ventricosus]|uniref:Uncharacterized protein n=1 Tax=Araneus ventricosus TaxID=182803 RepID=A0A4Y2V6D8_ARAVE|nr:hypothetical protein AVEN_9030-1 [Araneus ventricosus]
MDISGQTFPHHLERVSPDSFIFSPFHLGGSSIEAPYKRHSQPLQSLKATLFTPLSQESYTPPPPFCGFRFCERGSLFLTHDRISVLWPRMPNGKRDRMKIQTF